MGGMFTKSVSKSNKEITEKDRAILSLKINRDKLQKYRKTLEVDNLELKQQIKNLMASNKQSRALLLLKLMKLKENRVDEIDNQLLNVVEMIDNIEWQSQNLQVLSAIEAGTKALNTLHSEYTIDRIEELLDDSREAIQIENEIGKMLGGTSFSDEETTELEAELELLKRSSGSTPQDNLIFPIEPSSKITPINYNSVDDNYSEFNSSIESKKNSKLISI